MANAKGKITVGTTVDEDMLVALDKRATVEKRTRAAILARALAFYLAYAEIEPAGTIPKIKPTKPAKQKGT